MLFCFVGTPVHARRRRRSGASAGAAVERLFGLEGGAEWLGVPCVVGLRGSCAPLTDPGVVGKWKE